MNMNKILIKAFASFVLLVFMSAPTMASIPLGECPEGRPPIDISLFINSETPGMVGFGYALLAKDANGDGYACALFRCAPCPPNAQRCNLVCTWSGPLSDNDQ